MSSGVTIGGENPGWTTGSAAERRLRKRYAAERRFKRYGMLSIGVALAALALLLGSIAVRGYSGFFAHSLTLEVFFDPEIIDPAGTRDGAAIASANFDKLVRQSLYAQFPEVSERRDKKRLRSLISTGAGFEIGGELLVNLAWIGTTQPVSVPMSDEADLFFKGKVDAESNESDRRLLDQQIGWLRALDERGLVNGHVNRRFFGRGDSREPELAGIRGALVGTLLTLTVTLLLCFPLGVATAVYLEEFAPRNRLTDLIEVNINNLAAVPSIVFGLLGLAVLLNFAGMPRSAPVVGGIVLGLRTLPIVIIAARASMAAVPPSIREAALGVGASPLQTVLHHVLPLAMPGVLTGTIIGMAQALGETAPLLMIGMVAFIVDVPGGFTDPATVLPVQVYLWADSPERAFVEKTSAAILVLLTFLIFMNLSAVLLRKKFERRW